MVQMCQVATEDVGNSCDCLELASRVWQISQMLRLKGNVFRGPHTHSRQSGWENIYYSIYCADQSCDHCDICSCSCWMRYRWPHLTNYGVWPHLFFYLSWLETAWYSLSLSLFPSPLQEMRLISHLCNQAVTLRCHSANRYQMRVPDRLALAEFTIAWKVVRSLWQKEYLTQIFR